MNTVDILLPTANQNVTLIRRAIQSVVDQEYVDWRLFVGSNGNKTQAGNALQEFRDPRIQYFEFEPIGKPSTLNHLLAHSSAPYVAYLDDDDLWYPNHLKVAIEHLKKYTARFVHTDAFSVEVVQSPTGFREKSRRSLNSGPLSNYMLYSIGHINVVHERSLLEQVGPYDTKRPYYIDWDMFIRMAHVSKPYHVPIATCEHFLYQDAEGNLLNPISSRHKKDSSRSHEAKRENFLKARNLLSDEEFLALIDDLEEKSHKVLLLEDHLRTMRRTISWQVTKPSRWIARKLLKKS